MNLKRKTLSVLILTFSFGHTVASNTLEELGLPTTPTPYEMHIGAVDMSCFGGKGHDDAYDSDAKVLDATVTFTNDSDVTGSSSLAVIIIKTASIWSGLIDKATLKIDFQSQRVVDVVPDPLKKYDVSVNNILIERALGKYVRGTIHGTITRKIFVTNWLRDVVQCNGETTLLLIPKAE